MSAPTLWEEGHASGRRVVRLAITTGVLVTALDLLISPSLGLLFDIGFVLISVGAALMVRKQDFFMVGVLPPLLMVGLFLPIAVFGRQMLTSLDDSRAQALISALTHHSASLVIGYALCLVILVIRNQVINKHDHSKREGSPEPILITSGASEE
jgi:hypothetical protein